MSDQAKPSPEAENTDAPLSEEAFIARRMQSAEAPETEETEEPESAEEEPENEDADEASEDTEETTEDDDATEEPEAEGNQEIDLESLTPEQIQQLAKKGKSRLLQRIGELTAKNKALEDVARANAKPLPKPIADNPFSSLKTREEVEAKIAELEKVAEDTDRILDDHEDYGADDVIRLGNKEFTKKDIKTANRNARNALLKFLPAQQAEIVRSEQRKQMEAEYTAAIPLEIPEIADAESEVSKTYQSFIADPLVDEIKRSVPEIAPQIGWLLAHAARSIRMPKIKPKTSAPAPGVIPKPRPAGNPVPAGAARSGVDQAGRKMEQARKAYEETGSEEALVAARIAKARNI
jgi:hypothetical protein